MKIYEYDQVGSADATDLVGEALSHAADLAAIPVERLGADFFQLKTGVAGEIVQKFANYRVQVAIVGDITAYLEESNALRDWVREANRGEQVWFVPDLEHLSNRLGPSNV